LAPGKQGGGDDEQLSLCGLPGLQASQFSKISLRVLVSCLCVSNIQINIIIKIYLNLKIVIYIRLDFNFEFFDGVDQIVDCFNQEIF